jgi:predicted Zn-dependent protease
LQALKLGGESIVQPVGLQLLQLALYRRETEVAWRTAKLLAERFSRRAGNRNNYAYLSLLLNRDAKEATQAAEKAVKIGPKNPAFQSTLALARLRANRWEEALELMGRRDVAGLTPGERAIKAAIFLGLDRKPDAVSMAQGLRSEMMLPEEWNLLGSLAVEAKSKP